MGVHEGIRVLPVGQSHHTDGDPLRQQHVTRTKRRLLPGDVAVVEQKDILRLTGNERCLVLRERSTQRSDDGFDPGEHESDDVEIPLDEQYALVAPNGVPGPVETVQQATLRERRRIGGVEVFRLDRPDRPAAESRQSAGCVVDRKDQPAAKARPRFVGVFPLRQQSAAQQPVVVEAQRVEVPAQEPDLARREPEPEPLGRLTGDVAALEVIARRLPDRLIPQHALEILRRGRIELPHGLAWVGPLAARLDFPNLDPGLLGDGAHGRGPVHTEALLQEAEYVAVFVADEAVIHPLLGRHREVPVRALMERARAAPVGAHTAQVHVLADDLDDIGGVAHALDLFLRDHGGGTRIVRRTLPPSRRCRLRSTHRGGTISPACPCAASR